MSDSQELDEAKQQLAEAQQLLQAARDEIAALQVALQAAQEAPEPATPLPAESSLSGEGAERTLEAGSLVQMRLEAQVVSQQAAAEMAALVGELQSVEAALAQECQEGRASLCALSVQVQEKILEPLMVHWHRVQGRMELTSEEPTQPGLIEQDATAATDPAQQTGQVAASSDVKRSWDKLEFSLEDSSSRLLGLLARDTFERQLLLQALAQAEDDAAVRKPQPLEMKSVVGPDMDVLAGLRAEVQSATAAASTAAAATQATTILAAILFEDLATAKLQHKRERLNQRAQLAQSQADAKSAQDAELASKSELASLHETVASEREGQDGRNALEAQLRDLEGQLEAALTAEREVQEQLQAALEIGGDAEADGEVSELLVANRLLLAKVQVNETLVRKLTAELEEARAELAGAHTDDASPDVNCVVLTNDTRRAEEELEERISTERQLFQHVLSAQVPPRPTHPATTYQKPTVAPLQPRRETSTRRSCGSRLYGCRG